MKKIFLAFTLLLGFAVVGFAQDRAAIAKTEGKLELIKSKESGEYAFVLPSNVTEEAVEKNSKYYTEYFTVNFDDGSKEVEITMISEEDIATKVIGRFLISCGVQEVEIDGASLPVTDFIDKHL